METGDGEYVNSNWVETAFESLRLNLVALVKPSGQIAFGQAFDLENGQYILLSEELQTHLKPNDLLLQHLGPEPQSGILLLTEGAMLIASSPILTTEQSGPSRGSLVMGRYLDGAELARFVNLTRVSVKIYQVNEAQLSTNLQRVRASLLDKPQEIVVQPLGDNSIAGYAMLPDIYGDPALILQIDAPRDLYQQGLLSLQYLKLSLLIVGILAGLAICFLLSRLVRSLTERDRMEQALTQQEALRRSQQRYRDKAEELEKALGQLQMAQTRLVQNEKMSSLGQMVAGIAHELNNPVGFIKGNLPYIETHCQGLLGLVSLYQRHYPEPVDEICEHNQLIDLEFLIEDIGKILKSMWVGAERISQIVLSLRNFSRLNQMAMKPVDIHEGIDNTLIILQHRLKAQPNRPEIQVIKIYDDLPLVECYAGELNQVFMNLLANAIDALEEELGSGAWRQGSGNSQKTKDGGVTITAAKPKSAPYPAACVPYSIPTIQIQTELLENHAVVIRITDNGPGIPEYIQQKLFDPFFTTKPIGKGTGLGLSISYQIVEKHQGRLQCISKLGEGARFVIHLPVKQQYSVSKLSQNHLPIPVKGEGAQAEDKTDWVRSN